MPRRDVVEGRKNVKVRTAWAGRIELVYTKCTEEYAYCVTCAKNMK